MGCPSKKSVFHFFLLISVLLGWNNILAIEQPAFESTTAVVSGYVRDSESGEALSAATISFSDQRNERRFQVLSNDFGFYSITMPVAHYSISVSRLGYTLNNLNNTEQNIQLVLTVDTTIHLQLRSSAQIEEVVVESRRGIDQLRTPLMGLSRVDVAEIQQVPVLFGEKDLLKTIQLLPGVMSGGEGSSQFFVRGGQGDQNLILLDGATVFNASHLFGFFSTFNSDAIRDVDLYKGGMPAQYGGRLASVLDIRMQEGNNQTFHAEGGIGLIASRIKLEGPILRDRASFMVSGRRTYADLFLKLSSDPDINQSKLYFYDLNLKANFKVDDRNNLYVSGYFGEDILGYADMFKFGWGNSTGTIRWNHLLSNRLFSNTTAVYSDYDYRVDLLDEAVDFVIASSVRSAQLKQDFQLFTSGGNTLRFGTDYRYQQIQPSQIDAGVNSSVNSLLIARQNANELSAWISHEWEPTNFLSLVYGLRAQNYWLMGTQLQKQHYFVLEPRISSSFRLNESSSFKIAFNRTSQFLHQLTNTTSSLPTDAWVLSSRRVKPQLADQLSLGYYRNLAGLDYEFSVETYYKNMRNQIDYRDAADLQANNQLEEELVFGDGRAYGVEWYLKKNHGRLNGWISYALSKSERQFDDINKGAWFNARQDRTHDLSTVLIYELDRRWSMSATFVYSTGHAVTWPSGKYQAQDQALYFYSERNGYRMPNYHRLDVGVNWDQRISKQFSSSWSFGLYNAYNRRNAYIIDFRENESNPGQTDVYRVALFGAIPAISWNFKF